MREKVKEFIIQKETAESTQASKSFGSTYQWIRLNSMIFFRTKILQKIGDTGEFWNRIMNYYFSEHVVVFFWKIVNKTRIIWMNKISDG